MENAAILINAAAGSAKAFAPEDLQEQITAWLGGEADVRVLKPEDFGKALERAFGDQGPDTLIVGGGDGSISAAAALALSARKRLGVIPLGTMNLFARALGMPLDLEDAVRCLPSGLDHRVDVGRLGDRLFLNHVSLGLHPRMIRLRDQQQHSGQLAKIAASVAAFARTLRRPRSIPLDFDGDFEQFSARTPLTIVTVNPVSGRPLPIRDGQSAGHLALHVAQHGTPVSAATLAARLAAGNWSKHDGFTVQSAHHVTISGPDRIAVSMDGERDMLKTPLDIRIEPAALRVLVPSST